MFCLRAQLPLFDGLSLLSYNKATGYSKWIPHAVHWSNWPSLHARTHIHTHTHTHTQVATAVLSVTAKAKAKAKKAAGVSNENMEVVSLFPFLKLHFTFSHS